MDFRSSLMSAHSLVPRSWGLRGDCCSWERVRCNCRTRRVSQLDLSLIYYQDTSAAIEGGRQNLNLTIFSSFHELLLLDLSWNYACLRNFDGMKLRSIVYTCMRLLLLFQYCLQTKAAILCKHPKKSSRSSLMGSILGSLSKMVSLEYINLNGNNINGALQITGTATNKFNIFCVDAICI